jgi:hypothetical protein
MLTPLEQHLTLWWITVSLVVLGFCYIWGRRS